MLKDLLRGIHGDCNRRIYLQQREVVDTIACH